MLPSSHSAFRAWFVALALPAFLAGENARAQSVRPAPESWREPILGPELRDALRGDSPPPDTPIHGRAPRVRLFRMLPGFLSDPTGLDTGNMPEVEGGPAAPLFAAPESSGPERLQVFLGDDNPFLDARRPGDPGGVGFYQLYSQLQLLDSGTTSLCLNLQAFTPAGIEGGGAPDGPTVLMPGLGLFQELGGGSAVQGFVGQNIWAEHAPASPGQALQYGMAVQCPLLTPADGSGQGVYLFMQALGRYVYEGERPEGRASSWEFVPGVHWRLSEKCWMSLGASRSTFFNCSWQF